MANEQPMTPNAVTCLVSESNKIFSERDETEFKKQFVTGFLSNWAVMNNDDYCARGLHDELRNPPVEDAKHLAECAWEKWGDVIGYRIIHFAPENLDAS